MTTIIYTAYDCLIKGDGWQENLDQNEHLTLDDCPKRLSVYPLSRGKIAFEIDTEIEGGTYYRIVKKEDRVLIFLIEGITAQNVRVYDINAEGTTCKIEVEKSKVTFVCRENKKIICLGGQISSVSCGAFFHIAYAKLRCESCECLLAYNTKTMLAKAFVGQKITLTDEGFIVNSTPQNYEDATQEYVVTKAGLKLKKKDFVALGTPPPTHSLCYQFMSAVKLGDIENALSMLTPNLKNHLGEGAIKEYFGKLTYLFPIDECTIFAISNRQNIIYSFTLSGGLIADINDNKG